MSRRLDGRDDRRRLDGAGEVWRCRLCRRWTAYNAEVPALPALERE